MFDIQTLAKVFTIVLSLGLDTFAVSLSLGIAGLKTGKIKIGLSFASAEAAMPVIGLFLGRFLGTMVGNIAQQAGIILLALAGLYFIWESYHDDKNKIETKNLSNWKLICISLSVSLDELAIGLSLGLIHVPVALTIMLIALQAFVITMCGIIIGNHLGHRLAEKINTRTEMIAGILLCCLAVYMYSQV